MTSKTPKENTYTLQHAKETHFNVGSFFTPFKLNEAISPPQKIVVTNSVSII